MIPTDGLSDALCRVMSVQTHGHVFTHWAGVKARCGGPSFCGHCDMEARIAHALSTSTSRLLARDFIDGG